MMPLMITWVHSGSYTPFEIPLAVKPVPAAPDLEALIAARRKKSAIDFALTGQLLADVREWLDRTTAEIEKAHRKPLTRKKARVSLNLRSAKRARKVGRRR